MPLANIFLLCALAFSGMQSIRVFFQESQPQEASPKPDQAQEAPKAAQTEPSKPEEEFQSAANSRTAGRTESDSQIYGTSEDSRCIWRLATRAQPCFQGTAAF